MSNEVKIHPLADSYPMLSDEELKALADDIDTHGQAEPVVMSSDCVLLDGRNRLAAIELINSGGLGTQGTRRKLIPRVKYMTFAADSEEAMKFIESANLRRSMTTDQEIMRRVMHDLPRPKGRAQHTERAYEKAKRVGFENYDIALRVFRGEMTLSIAYNKLFPKKRKRLEKRPAKEVTVEDRLGATKAKAAASEAKREVKQLASELEQARAAVDAVASLTEAPLPPIQRLEFGHGMREATAVAMASDWHVEEMVRPIDTPNKNAFNLAIADHRAQRFFAAVEWSIRHAQSAFKIRHLVLWLGGDMTTGQLHEENLETGQLGPLEAMLWVQERIISGIRFLLDSDIGLEEIHVIGSYGNHGRFTKRMRSATGAGQNSDWLMYQSIGSAFQDEPRVLINADKGEHQYHRVYEFDLHFHHGHRINYGGGVGGIMIPINKAVSQWDKVRPCHYHHFGHFHQYIDHGAVTVNGSLIGYNGYAMSIKATPEDPRQSFYLLDSKRGKCNKTPLWVDDPSKEGELWEGGEP